MPFLLILLTRSRYRRLSRLLSLSPIYHAETVSSSRNLLIAAYTLYYNTSSRNPPSPAIHPSCHDLCLYTRAF